MGKNVVEGSTNAVRRRRTARRDGRTALGQGEGDTGCGVACVAFLTRRRYGRGLAFFEKPNKLANGKPYLPSELVVALGNAGKLYRRRSFGSTREEAREHAVPHNGIVCIRDEHYPGGHYLVRYGKEWMCPLNGGWFLSKLPGVPRSYLVPVG